MEMARHEAISAQLRQKESNKHLATQLKTEIHSMLQDREKLRELDLLRNKKTISEIHNQRLKTEEAITTKRQQNREAHDDLNRYLEEANKRRQDEIEANLTLKQQLIRQIREFEKVPIIRTNHYDRTETGGQGLLCEMSV